MFHSFKLPRRLSILGAALIILAFVVLGGLTGLALAQEPLAAPGGASAPPIVLPKAQPGVAEVLAQATAAPSAVDNSSDPSQKCAGCHADVLKSWTGSPHNLAFSDAKFQQGWEAQNQDPACLQCHTTNFSPATNKYEAQGVSCVACHGEIPADHPTTPVNLDKANTVCKDCHTVTFAEFRTSMHYAQGLQCTSCHYAHQQGLRLGDQVTQCTNCHATQLDDFAHASHVNAGLKCRNCHGYVDPGQQVPVDGLAATGHDFRESTHACLQCHQSIHLTASGGTADGGSFSSGTTQQTSAQGAQAALRITELENAYKSLVLENRNSNFINLLAGGLGGMVFGGVVVALYNRRRHMPTEGGGPYGY